MPLATNDHTARDYAQGQGVKVISLQALLREMWVSGLYSKVQVREFLERIKVADYLTVPLEVESEIFGDA
jgi:predicted nucleic acid-binding protein